MQVLEIFGICIAALCALLFVIFFRRRLLNSGGGTIRLQVRVSTMVPGRGWSTGIGQFVGDELRFHRMFSLAYRPKRVLVRTALLVEQRRSPEGPERLIMGSHWVILRCATIGGELEIAMAEHAATGFLSWLEAGPPGRPGASPPGHSPAGAPSRTDLSAT
jgi:hypothetical protein